MFSVAMFESRLLIRGAPSRSLTDLCSSLIPTPPLGSVAVSPRNGLNENRAKDKTTTKGWRNEKDGR